MREEGDKAAPGKQDREGMKGSTGKGDGVCAAWHKGSEPWRRSSVRAGELRGWGKDLLFIFTQQCKFYSSMVSSCDFIASITEVELLKAPAPGVKSNVGSLAFVRNQGEKRGASPPAVQKHWRA